ncbi:hypothetical protein BRE01_65890 [Brevibacillus reuszeri]|uniref:MarR family transcriptional regulator n=1 Tax=Brevibacillus reuszeri TaxID=54915 RepID=A0A0K9YUE5_9BACL|nr:MarR family transcriptional regulator [Brevibacillus reuszeri]KNB72306.1 MarR family transcriptional regulator [Brevibacillus reuszeri]MED1861048.1 MarR family transcriptional regulator [Brevibacillus reuszeri]GED72887.1 hypothetical protein BRE01_65890 [Brevibacillus reuszeri]
MNREELTAFVREINELEYACNAMLTEEYHALQDENITNSQIVLLGHLHQQGRLLTGELSKIMNITPSAVSQSLNKLEKANYIKRFINPDNRREIFVELDSAGIKYMENSEQIELSIIDRFYSKLDVEDLKNLKGIFSRFKVIIEKEKTQK